MVQLFLFQRRAAVWRRAALMTVVCLALVAPAGAITLTLDYSYDTSNFFGAGNPNGAAAGAQAKAAVQAAAGFYSNILQDSFSAVAIPPDFYSQVFNGVAFWDTELTFFHPSTGALVTVNGQTRAADEYRIYVGAHNLGGTTLGLGGPTSAGWSQDYSGDGFTQSELDDIDDITAAFSSDVETRGQGEGFSAWGGTLAFDSVGTAWHYNHTTAPIAGLNDFYSVAIHELGHSLGLGASDQWDFYAGGSNFLGPKAIAEYGSAPPLNFAHDHWASGTQSTVFGTNTPQEAAMDPEVTTGTRKRLTDLDAAALTDIDWEVMTPVIIYHQADFNADGSVNNGDYLAWKLAFGAGAGADADDDGDSDGRDFLFWQRNIGAPPPIGAVPEPGAVVLGMLAGAALVGVKRR